MTAVSRQAFESIAIDLFAEMDAHRVTVPESITSALRARSDRGDLDATEALGICYLNAPDRSLAGDPDLRHAGLHRQ